MPNNYSTRIECACSEETWTNLKNIFSHPEPFQRLLPCPHPLLQSGDWYNWRCENWGTKWDAYDIELDNDRAEICMRTAWAPPLPILNLLQERYPDLQMRVYGRDEFEFNETLIPNNN